MVLFIHLSSLGQLFQDELILFKRKSVLKCQGERFAFKHSFFSGICLKLLVILGWGLVMNPREICQRLFQPPSGEAVIKSCQEGTLMKGNLEASLGDWHLGNFQPRVNECRICVAITGIYSDSTADSVTSSS